MTSTHVWTVIAATVAMLAADILSGLLTQAEARNKAVLAGLLDAAGWAVGIVVTLTTINALQGHNLGLKAAVVVAVSAANFCGSWAGVKLGERYVKMPSPLAAVVADHDIRLAELEQSRPAWARPVRNERPL